MSADNEGWSSECPTTPGDYWFKSDEQPQVQATVALRDGKLCVWFEGEGGMPIRLAHIAEENPQWRPLRTSETPLTDAAEYPASTFANAPSDVKVVNSELARMLETKLAEAEKDKQYWKDLAMLHAEDRNAWKSVAERLGKALNLFEVDIDLIDDEEVVIPVTCQEQKVLRDALAELERLRKGES